MRGGIRRSEVSGAEVSQGNPLSPPQEVSDARRYIRHAEKLIGCRVVCARGEGEEDRYIVSDARRCIRRAQAAGRRAEVAVVRSAYSVRMESSEV